MVFKANYENIYRWNQWPESEIETDKNGFLQYDVLEALNMEKMMSTISCWMESARRSVVSTDRESAEEIPILIIEGFLLFNYKPLDTIWNRSYFLTIPYEECKRRRSTRVYEPPDSPGYFDGHVWPMYLKHRQEMQDITWEVGKCLFSLCSKSPPFTCHLPQSIEKKGLIEKYKGTLKQEHSGLLLFHSWFSWFLLLSVALISLWMVIHSTSIE